MEDRFEKSFTTSAPPFVIFRYKTIFHLPKQEAFFYRSKWKELYLQGEEGVEGAVMQPIRLFLSNFRRRSYSLSHACLIFYYEMKIPFSERLEHKQTKDFQLHLFELIPLWSFINAKSCFPLPWQLLAVIKISFYHLMELLCRKISSLRTRKRNCQIGKKRNERCEEAATAAEHSSYAYMWARVRSKRRNKNLNSRLPQRHYIKKLRRGSPKIKRSTIKIPVILLFLLFCPNLASLLLLGNEFISRSTDGLWLFIFGKFRFQAVAVLRTISFVYTMHFGLLLRISTSFASFHFFNPNSTQWLMNFVLFWHSR